MRKQNSKYFIKSKNQKDIRANKTANGFPNTYILESDLSM